MDLRIPPETQPCHHVHASLINPPVQVSHLAAPEEEKHQCQHSIDALAIIDAYKRKPCRKHRIISHPTYLFLAPFKTKSSNIKLPTFTKVLTSATCFSQGLGPTLFRFVKLFFHQPTQRTRHFQCRNFRRCLVLLLILSTSLIQVLSNVGKDFSQRKKHVPHELCESGFPKHTPEVWHDITPEKGQGSQKESILPTIIFPGQVVDF